MTPAPVGTLVSIDLLHTLDIRVGTRPMSLTLGLAVSGTPLPNGARAG